MRSSVHAHVYVHTYAPFTRTDHDWAKWGCGHDDFVWLSSRNQCWLGSIMQQAPFAGVDVIPPAAAFDFRALLHLFASILVLRPLAFDFTSFEVVVNESKSNRLMSIVRVNSSFDFLTE